MLPCARGARLKRFRTEAGLLFRRKRPPFRASAAPPCQSSLMSQTPAESVASVFHQTGPRTQIDSRTRLVVVAGRLLPPTFSATVQVQDCHIRAKAIATSR